MVQITRIPPDGQGGARMNEAAAKAVPGAADPVRINCAGIEVRAPLWRPRLISDGSGVGDEKDTKGARALGACALGAAHNMKGLVPLEELHLPLVRMRMSSVEK